jgi:hypothetical protein
MARLRTLTGGLIPGSVVTEAPKRAVYPLNDSELGAWVKIPSAAVVYLASMGAPEREEFVVGRELHADFTDRTNHCFRNLEML